tara:strand:- start:2268 stop:2609 length:342 start_codon:yes stop_codon:yes gene_type:complete
MISLKKILYEVLNNFSVEVDIYIDPQFNTYDILNELRALRRVTVVSIITPDDYTQSAGDEYIRLRMKFVTRGNSEEALQGFLDSALSSDKGETDYRIEGLKSMKFRKGTLKRL